MAHLLVSKYVNKVEERERSRLKNELAGVFRALPRENQKLMSRTVRYHQTNLEIARSFSRVYSIDFAETHSLTTVQFAASLQQCISFLSIYFSFFSNNRWLTRSISFIAVGLQTQQGAEQ